MAKNAVIQVAKERRQALKEQVFIAEGIRFKVKPVSTSLIQEVTLRLREPQVPIMYNEDKGRDEPNPFDPTYTAAVEDVTRNRGLAAMNAMIMFGIELLDDVPASGSWLKYLKKLEKLGTVDLHDYDLTDPDDLEFLFKKFVVASSDVIDDINYASGIRTEEIDQAEASFPDN